ncbi:ATP-binding protein [Halobaculum halobium]|uniref:ATP-binding protein n=3 Tax=Halobaculum halobium TaxID=3032281 RepID=A0ABD5TCW2_9EURY|nr:ATP-binding protein [Halobaculum sp. SYNS20]
MPLGRFADAYTEEAHRLPLGSVIDTLTETTGAGVYQALITPHPDLTGAVSDRIARLQANQDTFRQQVANTLLGAPDPQTDVEDLLPTERDRIAGLETRHAHNTFTLTARAGVTTDEAGGTRLARELADAFETLSTPFNGVDGRVRTGRDARGVIDDLAARVSPPPAHGGRRRLPGTSNATRGIVVDEAELASFAFVDGNALTAEGGRTLAPTPGERHTLPAPPVAQLERYHTPGLLLGHPLGEDGTSDPTPIALPPSHQPMHTLWSGRTGHGKTIALINAILANHEATAGASIVIDPKGDGMPTELLRAHYARHGNLDDVVYFDCAEVLPALSFFDIRAELAAGVDRTTAVEDRVDHYLEILMQVMGRERFERAVRAPDIIRYLVKAMFDPVSGYDAYSHRQFHSMARQMHERRAAPPVSDGDLERMLEGVVSNRAQTFDELMGGVANRIEKIPVDRRLAAIFNHVPEGDDPHFDLADYLDEDVLLIFDTGGLRSEAQRVLTLVLLSNLWTALRRRKLDPHTETERDDPLVNLYLEEAASVAVSDLLSTLLSQARSFDCAVTLATQFPGQFAQHEAGTYEEVLNNVSTIITGNVPLDRDLAERLATEDLNSRAVRARLRALKRGQWFVSLPAGFGKPAPRPFLVESAPLPAGHPESTRPLTPAEETRFQHLLQACAVETGDRAGIHLTTPGGVDRDGAEEDDDAVDPEDLPRIDSALPYTNRLPEAVEYDAALHALRCQSCSNRYDPDIRGMQRAIRCCHSMDAVEKDDIPICDLNVKLTPDERAVSEWDDHHLMFLQAVYNAQQLRYDPLEYDLLSDSMIRLQEYVGIDSSAIHDLIDAGLLRHDTDHPHRLYTVTPDGRTAIGESYRQGVDYGHGAGDLEESSQHVFAIELARQYLITEYVDDPESSVAEVIPYYDLDENRRLDIAAVDEDGEIVIAVEAERVNHDLRRAVPEDFDKMADCDVEEAIWVVMTRSAGHDVLGALNDPLDGDPRVEKTYSPNTPPSQFRIDTPGLTAVFPVEYLRKKRM